MTNDDDHED